MARDVLKTAKSIKRRNKMMKTTMIAGLSVFAFLSVIYMLLTFIFNGGKFTISLESNDALVASLALYDDIEYKEVKRKLYADEIDFMDNISIKWLPNDIDSDDKEGSHNGQNYIAYTFFLENTSEEIVNYYYEVVIDDVIKNVDDAVRIMIYRNGEKTIYAKKNADTEEAEEGTVPFYENSNTSAEHIAVLEKVNNFKPNDIDRFTIVVWLEGDDPDCVNAIIGGDIKMHMNIREEHFDQREVQIDITKENENNDENLNNNLEQEDLNNVEESGANNEG